MTRIISPKPIAWLLFVLAAASHAADLPTEIHLTNGAIVHQAVILRWETDSILVQHLAGTDPIRFEYIVPEERAIFEAHKKTALAEQARALAKLAEKQAKAARAEDAREAREAKTQQEREQHAAAIQDGIDQHRLVVGMTMDQVKLALGSPTRSSEGNSSAGAHVHWLYAQRGKDIHGAPCDVTAVFHNGILTSWTGGF
jgi:hypothetical protein